MLVEVVCCSVEDALLADRLGADRIELCSNIESGGITPSIGLIEEVIARVSIPVIVLIRPRAGDFVYSDSELGTMRRDSEAALAAGAAGFAIGCLRSDQTIDTDGCRTLFHGLGGERVFHRAFDLTPELESSLEQAAELGFTRILTSGGFPTALEGASALASLRQLAGDRIEILAAGGIRAGNVVEVIRRTGANQIHLGPFKPANPGGRYGTAQRLDDGELKSVLTEAAKTSESRQ